MIIGVSRFSLLNWRGGPIVILFSSIASLKKSFIEVYLHCWIEFALNFVNGFWYHYKKICKAFCRDPHLRSDVWDKHRSCPCRQVIVSLHV